MTRHYSNVSKTMSLQVGINSLVTSCTVDDASGLPASYPFNIVLDYGAATVEIVSCTNVAGNVLTITRGQEDTAAASHAVGAVVVHAATALDLSDAADHIAATGNVHGVGVTGNVVGHNTVQTLTNKTMSGASNTFTALPASAVTGTFASLTTSGLTTTVGVTTTGAITATGQAITAATLVTTGIVTAGGLLTASAGISVGGSVSGSGQAFTTGTITASGLITANAGVTVPSGQTLTLASGSTLTNAATGTHSGTNTFSGTTHLNAATNLGAAGTLGQAAGHVASMAGTLTMSTGTFNVNSGATANFNGTLNRDSSTARMLMAASETYLAASTNPVGAANSYNDISGCTFDFTVPAGRTAVVDVTGVMNILGIAGTASFELVSVLDGVANAQNPIVTTTSAINYPISKRWIYTGVAAGAHTIKLQYRNTNGNLTATILGGQSRTSQMVLVYW